MAEQLLTTSAGQAAPPALTCRLRRRTQGRAAESPLAGEVELENTSDKVLEIDVTMSPLQHLNLVVTDESGVVVSQGHYGNRFSPLAEPYTLRLQPGEKFTGPVSLLGNVPGMRRQPGEYSVRAVYEYNGLTAISQPIAVRIPHSGE